MATDTPSKPASAQGTVVAWKLVPEKMTASMINAWSGGLAVSSDEIAYRTTFQDAWSRVLDASPEPFAGAEITDLLKRLREPRPDGSHFIRREAADTILALALAAAPAPASSPPSRIWRDIKTAPKGRCVLVKFQSGEVEVCYQTDHGEGLKDSWRFAFADRGRQAPWPVEWCEIPASDATANSKAGDEDAKGNSWADFARQQAKLRIEAEATLAKAVAGLKKLAEPLTGTPIGDPWNFYQDTVDYAGQVLAEVEAIRARTLATPETESRDG